MNKKLRITFEVIDDKGQTLHARCQTLRMSDGIPCRETPLISNGSSLQRYAHDESSLFWDEVVGLGFLDDYMRPWNTAKLPPMDGGDK